MDHLEIKKRFKNDVADHEMTVNISDGVHRHLLFKIPKKSQYWFEIITGPYFLLIRGDMGSYSFSRTNDMFNFFTIDKNDFNYGEDLPINIGYWAEKLESICKLGGYKKFSSELFNEFVMREVNSFIYEEERDVSKEVAEELIEEVKRHLIGAEVSSSDVAYHLLYDFSSFADERFQFDYDRLEGSHFEEPSYSYIWCLYAIVWAVQKFNDEHKKEDSK